MQQEVITVASLEEATSRNGNAFWRVRVAGDEGRRLIVWSRSLAQLLTPGETYRVEVDRASGYPTIVAAEPVAAEPSPPPPRQAAAAEGRDMQDLRIAALRAAAQVMQGSRAEPKVLIRYAEVLLDWLDGGLRPDRA